MKAGSCLDGVDIRRLTTDDLRRAVVMVTQESFLFSGTVADNIAFGRPDATRAEIEAAARAIGAHEFISRLPDGYDTDVHKRGGRLSAGQRQLVAFARAFLADPRVLILDEATSSLDIPSERLVQRALRTLLADRTAVIIAHRLTTVEIADRVLVVDDGRIVEDGAPADLIAGIRPLPRPPRSLARVPRLERGGEEAGEGAERGAAAALADEVLVVAVGEVAERHTGVGVDPGDLAAGAVVAERAGTDGLAEAAAHRRHAVVTGDDHAEGAVGGHGHERAGEVIAHVARHHAQGRLVPQTGLVVEQTLVEERVVGGRRDATTTGDAEGADIRVRSCH